MRHRQRGRPTAVAESDRWRPLQTAKQQIEYELRRVAAIDLIDWRRLANSERFAVAGRLGLLAQDLSEQRWAFAQDGRGTGMYACSCEDSAARAVACLRRPLEHLCGSAALQSSRKRGGSERIAVQGHQAQSRQFMTWMAGGSLPYTARSASGLAMRGRRGRSRPPAQAV